MKVGIGLLGAFVALLAVAPPAAATGVYTCDSVPREDWKSKEELKAALTEQGWKVRLIKEDGGCWEVYAIDPTGHPRRILFSPRHDGEALYHQAMTE